MLSADPPEVQSDLEAVMTMQIIFTIMCCASSGFLLWCLNGFTRALQQGRKAVGLVVKVVDADSGGAISNHVRRNPSTISVRSRPRPQLLRPAVSSVPADVAGRLEDPRGAAVPELLTDSSSNIAS